MTFLVLVWKQVEFLIDDSSVQPVLFSASFKRFFVMTVSCGLKNQAFFASHAEIHFIRRSWHESLGLFRANEKSCFEIKRVLVKAKKCPYVDGILHQMAR